MKKSKLTPTVKAIVNGIDKGTYSFEYPIQREGGQWSHYQKSLLIHSYATDYPVPAIYSVVEIHPVTTVKKGEEITKDVSVYMMLDGKQRMTNTYHFYKGMDEFEKLHADTPTVKIDGEEIEIAGKRFDELPEEIQERILDFTLDHWKIDEATDEEIEDMFYRLNNGTPLSKMQQGKAKMGTEWAIKIKGLVKHPMMNVASFSPAQLRNADNELAILQTLMLLDENYEIKSFSSGDVAQYALTFKDDVEHKDTLVAKVATAMDYLAKAFNAEPKEGQELIKEKDMLKKVHFPMTLLTALDAIEMGVSPEQFATWAEDFKAIFTKGKNKRETSIKTKYLTWSGAGSVKKPNTINRVKEMIAHFESYVVKNFEIEIKEEEVAPVVELVAPAKEEEAKQEELVLEASSFEPESTEDKGEGEGTEEGTEQEDEEFGGLLEAIENGEELKIEDNKSKE